MTQRDIEAIKDNIEEGHPGIIDPANPSFKITLESGYKNATNLAYEIVSYEGYKAVLDQFLARFNSGHLYIIPSIEKIFVQWPKFIVKYQNNAVIVAYRVDDNDLQVPPLGSKFIACDGISVKKAISLRVFPFHAGSSHLEGVWEDLTPFLLVDDGNPFLKPIKTCTIDVNGKEEKFTLAWEPINKNAWNEKLNTVDQSINKQKFGIREVSLGGVWVSIPTFSAAKEADLESLNNTIDKIGQFRNRPYIVIDLRGNSGGNSVFGERLIENLYGKETLEWLNQQNDIYSEWRVSKISVHYLENALKYIKSTLGIDAPVYKIVAKDLENMKKALSSGQQFLRSDQNSNELTKRNHSKVPPISSVTAKVFILTDGHCGSSCLTFCDLILNYPGVIQIGLPTFGDDAYVEGMRIPLPSGLGVLVIPVKVIRNLPRKNYEPYTPQYVFEGDIRDTKALEKWVLELYQENLGEKHD